MSSMPVPASRIVPLIAAGPRRANTRPPHERVSYELARLRAADTREPPARYAHLAVPHD
jgi:hypothetical protein